MTRGKKGDRTDLLTVKEAQIDYLKKNTMGGSHSAKSTAWNKPLLISCQGWDQKWHLMREKLKGKG